MKHADVCPCQKCRGCSVPIWPSNSANELLYGMQILFSQDNHNHAEVIHENTYNLPLRVPENEGRSPFSFCNATSGRVETAPYSKDTVLHVNWVPYRLQDNLNTPWGSDSDIYFQDVAPAEHYNRYQDWLDVNARDKSTAVDTSIDEKVANCCDGDGKSGVNQVCSMTCVDWWTNRPVPPQGSMTRADGSISGGCPWNTMQALSCYPCNVHRTYVNGK